jgi:hypothetical protein
MSADDPTPPKPLRDLGSGNVSAKVVRREVWRRANVENKHWMGCLVGREGIGKSHSALSILKTCDPSFSAEDVYFDPKELLEAFQSDAYGPGDAIMLDEAGVGLGSRSWYEKEQVLLNQTLQTVRDDRLLCCFTLPRLSELDSQTRGRLHSFVELTELEPGQYTLAKWKQVIPARDERSDIFYPYPEVKANGKQRRVERVRINPPPEALAAAYEERKEAFKKELYEEAIDAYEEDEEDDGRQPSEVADEIVDGGVSGYMSEHGGNGRRYVDQELIRAEFGLSHRDAKAAKKLVEKHIEGSQNTQSS